MRTLPILAAIALAAPALAQTGVDGLIGTEWSGPGVSTRTITFDASAPNGGFGSPGTTNELVAYTTYFRGDGAFVYAAVQARPDLGGAIGAVFGANLYFSTLAPSNGSIAMEVTNNRFFRGGVNTGGPNNDGYYPATGFATWSASPTTGVIELAIPYSFFTADPLGMGFAPSAGSLRWNLSQSFGYAVAGGSALSTPGGPDDRFGIITGIPAPGAASLLALGGLLAARRRRD